MLKYVGLLTQTVVDLVWKHVVRCTQTSVDMGTASSCVTHTTSLVHLRTVNTTQDVILKDTKK